MEHIEKSNFLGDAPIGKLLLKFGIPAIISMVTSAMYNIVDQIFIGQGVGMYGNAATNVALPLTTLTLSVGLLAGIGGAANFNLAMGRNQPDKARKIMGSAYGAMMIAGFLIAVAAAVFLEPLLLFFGATPEVMPYAIDYVSVTLVGLPFFLVTAGAGHLIRADSSPNYSMAMVLSGAVINLILDPLFIFVFHWGMRGAAWATVIGQVFSALMVFYYIAHPKTIKLSFSDIIPRWKYLYKIAALGIASGFNQIALMVMQIVMNNVLRRYGADSVYGSDIPLAAVGIVTKVNMIYFSIIIGLAQGAQPIMGYNYGAKKYSRVREAFFATLKVSVLISVLAFAVFQLFPKQILSLFGSGDPLYFQFAVPFFRVFLFGVFVSGIQPLTGQFFSSIGMAWKGLFTHLVRQALVLIPLLLLLPAIFGIDGIKFAGPAADCTAGLVSVFMITREFKKMGRKSLAE